MLTQEQIENLKNSDKLLVQGEFIKAHDNGSILVSLSTNAWESSIHELLFFHPSSVFLPSEHGTSLSRRSSEGTETEVPTPKHDPTRLFRNGDQVRIVEYKGRSTRYDTKIIYEVCEDEEKSGRDVKLSMVDYIGHFTVDAAYLELVTPVEELEPYYIETEDFDSLIYNSNGDPDCETLIVFHIKYQDEDERKILNVKSYYQSYVYSYEHAKADAEAECKRLNDEWRKEQK